MARLDYRRVDATTDPPTPVRTSLFPDCDAIEVGFQPPLTVLSLAERNNERPEKQLRFHCVAVEQLTPVAR